MYNLDRVKKVRERGWLHGTVGGQFIERRLVLPPGLLQKVGNTGLKRGVGGLLEGPQWAEVHC